ncbi:MAG: cupredoxin domain-containing protein [Polyangiaceae bacterium]|nr:cupredoxin domain-containing protein [Polyangiaceae bacterium]
MKTRPIVLASVVLAAACDPAAKPHGSTPAASVEAPAVAAGGSIQITVDASGYHPATVKAPAGKAAKLLFKRTSDEGCGDKLVFPALGISKDLPLGVEVPVDITMPASGSLAFTCGMDMYRGSVVAQ